MKLFLYLFVFSFWTISLAAHNTCVLRAAIDVGAAGPKLRIAEVDRTTNKITKILYTKQWSVFFQDHLSKNSDKKLSPEIMFEGLRAIKEALALAKSFEIQGVVIVGASPFRKALNADEFAKNIYLESGLPIHILDQELEAKLAFQAALAKSSSHLENLVAWDIGGGSTQFITLGLEGEYLFEGSSEGSGPFRDLIVESIQKRSLKEYKSPNPLSDEEVCLAKVHAELLASNVTQVFKDKLCHSETRVVGVGSVFGRGIASLVRGKNPFTTEDLEGVIHDLIGKTDCDLGGGDFACVEVSNAILVYGFMKELGIQKMHIMDVNNADGAIVYNPFWTDKQRE